MSSMMEALKAKRMGQPAQGGLMTDDAPAYGDQQEQPSPMADLLSKLSPDQKQELSGLLEQDPDVADDDAEVEPGEETPGSQIAKGDPSSVEKAKIDTKMQSPAGPDESDDIQMGMLDSRSKSAPADTAPRNLGERARLAAAQRLKGKGKL